MIVGMEYEGAIMMQLKRKSGILLHVTSLPSPFGIGDMGPDAFRFADFLHGAGQRVWQVLPLNPTRVELGNSPYSSPSAFAGNPLLISPILMVREGYLSGSDIKDTPGFPAERVDYPLALRYKQGLFKKAFACFSGRGHRDYGYLQFCGENAFWLNDHALFEALKVKLGSSMWNGWTEPLRDREKGALEAAEKELKKEIEEVKFFQYIFFRQWSALKRYCNSLRIQIIGDIPLYVNHASSDAWANPGLFKLSSSKAPMSVSGVPPDYFSKTGQLWGNPIYRWTHLKRDGYSWWVRRVTHNLRLFDCVRLDHFRGFAGFWEVPAHHETARKGKWVRGPGEDLFTTLLDHFSFLPFIAEDLGHITPDVRELRDRFGFPGMRILQFAFGKSPSSDLHKPHNYTENCVAYTGTHDNQTLMGWLLENHGESPLAREQMVLARENALKYIGHRGRVSRGVRWEFIRLLMMSSAFLVIIPMQDVLGVGQEGRMNRPAIPVGNWEWRMAKGRLGGLLQERLLGMTELYGRN